MNVRIRRAALGALSTCAMALAVVPAAQANILSLLPGSCAGEVNTQAFSEFGDDNWYTPVPGGGFEAGTTSWTRTGGATPVEGNESFYIGNAGDSRSLRLPAGSAAVSPAVCAAIDKPTLRFFARNTGSSASRLNVDAYYPGLLGGSRSARIGTIGATSAWAPTNEQQLTLTNLLATLSLSRTVIAFRFSPADASGNWAIDDVYVDPKMRG
jgi:hypothetical protein